MNRRFALHYVEMVVAMFLGMGILLPPLGIALRAAGLPLHGDSTLMITAMALTMTAPMVGWMRFRGHAWAPCAEMAAAMLIPTVAVLALLWSGLVGELGTLLLVEHVAMLPAMLIAMLMRRAEYSGHHHHRAQEAVAS